MNDDWLGISKRPGQKWVFFAVESPFYHNDNLFNLPAWRGQFDYTMTYRRNSDLLHSYGCVMEKNLKNKKCYVRDFSSQTPLRIEEGDDVLLRQQFKKKTKTAAWVVSHCETQSKREEYVKRMSKVYPVDIYGKCGDLTCEDREGCLTTVQADYKFYIAFENSICQDYYTEKVINVLLKGGIIPVVRGRANYKEIFPPLSVIDAADFSSPEELGNFLKELSVNETGYIQYFAWRQHYQALGPDLPLCQLCDKLSTPRQEMRTYHNIYNWWRNGMCSPPKDLQ